MHKIGWAFIVSQSIAALVHTNPVQSLTQLYTQQQLIRSGRQLYSRHCAGCHGIDAKGAGPARPFLVPKPRNLVEGSFKLRSTPMGTLPTRDDLMRTITRGIPNSAMPAFKFLASNERESLVAYIQSLRPEWHKSQGEAIAVPAIPDYLRKKETFLASAFKGQKNFMELCATCHGDTGKGDGPGGAELFDEDNQAIRPANLGARYLKSGPGIRDIFRTISTGLDGTPMVGFGDALPEDQRWDLAAYILYLRGKEAGVYPADLSLETYAKKK